MRLTRRWPTLLTSSWLRSVGYFCGKCWQMQMLGKNVLMSEEFEGPHGQSMLHSKLRKSESLKFVWTFWTKLFTPVSQIFFYFFTLSYCSLFCCVLEHCVTLRSKDKTKNMWNMWKGIHSSFKPEQAHCHHRGEKPLIGPNLCQLWLQFDHNVSIEKARDGAHCIGPTQRPIRKTFFFLMLFPVYKR